MRFSQFLATVRARYPIILFTLMLTVATALIVSLLQARSYRATATVVLNSKGLDAVSGVTNPVQLMPDYMATQVDIITSRRVALMVVDRLKLAEGTKVQREFLKATKGRGTLRDWLAAGVLKNLDVVPSRESSVLGIHYQHTDPQFAADAANAFAGAYQQTGVELRVEPLRKASAYFSEQIKMLRLDLEGAQQRLSGYQQEKGLVSADFKLDNESARLSELSSQLVEVQGQLVEAQSRRRTIDHNGGGESPDVISSQLIQVLKAEVAKAESKFSQASQNLGVNHPLYQAIKSEVEQARAELAANTRSTINSVTNTQRIMQRREAEIRAALEAQKTRVLRLNRTRDELAVLVKETEAAQRAYDTAAQRFTQTSLEGQANQTDVAVLNPAITPLQPSGPKVLLNTLLAGFLGSLLGLAFAVLAELLDRRVRSTGELDIDLSIPVLGAIDWRAPGQSRFSRAALLAWLRTVRGTSMQQPLQPG